MLKRATKITSLLVTAASIVSMVPAMAADVKKVAAEEGTVYQMKVDGPTTYLDAELNDKDEAVYTYKDGKYTKLDNAEPGDTFGDIYKYDGKTYLEMADGDYYVNVANGEKTDEDIKGNVDDDAESAARKAIKSDNDGRFDKDFSAGTITAEIDHGKIQTLYGATGTWRRYNYKLETARTNGETYSTVFSDDKGKYIDADYNLGNIGVYNTTGASVIVKNTEDTYKLAVDGTAYEIKAQIVGTKVNGLNDEGNDYITRTADLSIWGTTDNWATKVNLTSKLYFGSANNKHKQDASTGAITVMQRISKAQSSDSKDGIKYAKDAKTYFMTKDDGTVQHFFGLSDAANADSNSHGYGWFSGGSQGYIVSQYHDLANKKQFAETVNFKTKDGYNYTDVDDADSVEVAYVDASNPDTYAYAIGAGDFYALSHDGYIEEFIAKDSSWQKLYKVDGGMNKINACLPIFAGVWNKDDGNYSIITPGAPAGDKKDDTTAKATTVATTTTVAATTATKAGWVQATNGTWSFVKADGTKATAWYQDGTTWYYLNATGVMQTGWVNDNGTWYYCNESGAMLANTTVSGYVLGANGAWVK